MNIDKKPGSKRIKSIDIVRGIAIVQMVFWQVFDFLAKSNIYGDSPYFIKAFNAPPHFSVLALFLSMSGASIYLSMSKRLQRGMGKGGVLKHVLRRYGLLIVASLFFTTFVFDFCTFFRWEEAIQGIGLAAIVTSIIILSIPSNSVLLLTITGLILLQPLIVNNIWPLTRDYMFCNTNMGISQLPVSLLFNISLRGFFSFTNLLPSMLVGVLLGKAVVSGLLKKKICLIGFLGVVLIVSAIALHLLGNLIVNFYGRSYSSLLLEIGIAVSLFSIVEYILMKAKKIANVFDFFFPFGMASLVSYFGHFLLVYKLLQIVSAYSGIQIIGTMLPIPSAVLSLLSLLFFYWVSLAWLRRR